MDNVPPFPPQPASPYLPPPRPPNWFQRNWPWFVPTGCVGLLVVLAAFVGGIMLIVVTAMKSSDPYKVAVQRAETNERVTAALGMPVTEGWFLTGNINVNGGGGNANISVPLSGPKGKGTLYVNALKSEGVWEYQKLFVRVDGTGEAIDLNTPAPAPAPAP